MDERREIQRRKLQMFEAVAAAYEAGAAAPAQLTRVGNEYRRRTAMREVARPGLGRRRQKLWEFLFLCPPWLNVGQAALPITGWMWLSFGAVIAFLLDGMLGAAMLAACGALVAMTLGLDHWEIVRYRRMISTRCRNCRAELAGVPDALPTDAVGAPVGPRRCPGCGLPWPRVPAVDG